MSDVVIQLPLSQLLSMAEQAGRAGGQSALVEFAERTDRLLVLVEEAEAGLRPVLSVAEAARYACVSPGTVRQWIRGGMPAEKVGGRAGYRVLRADVDAWMHGRGRSAAGDKSSER